MGTISNIIDALRRVGTPTQKSALRRQDEQLRDKQIVGRRREVFRCALGTAETLIATVAPAPETVTVLTSEELDAVLESANGVARFLNIFLSTNIGKWSLNELDVAFERWINSNDKRGYGADVVVQIAGAAFGQFCVENLDMRWVKIVDNLGTSLGVQGIEKDFRAYPFSVVQKRIIDSEFGFFKPVYISIEAASRGDWERTKV